MNDYRVTFLLDGHEQTREITAETVKSIEARLPADAEVIGVKWLRARSFSCRARGTPLRRQ